MELCKAATNRTFVPGASARIIGVHDAVRTGTCQLKSETTASRTSIRSQGDATGPWGQLFPSTFCHIRAACSMPTLQTRTNHVALSPRTPPGLSHVLYFSQYFLLR